MVEATEGQSIGHMTSVFHLDKVTQGTHRFKEQHEPGMRPPVGQLYITKDALALLGHPSTIEVTIVPLDEE